LIIRLADLLPINRGRIAALGFDLALRLYRVEFGAFAWGRRCRRRLGRRLIGRRDYVAAPLLPMCCSCRFRLSQCFERADVNVIRIGGVAAAR
jgi:hypothetical protein